MIRIFITIKHLKVKKTTEVLIILIYVQKQKSFFSSKINIPVQNAERIATAAVYSLQLQIQIIL